MTNTKQNILDRSQWWCHSDHPKIRIFHFSFTLRSFESAYFVLAFNLLITEITLPLYVFVYIIIWNKKTTKKKGWTKLMRANDLNSKYEKFNKNRHYLRICVACWIFVDFNRVFFHLLFGQMYNNWKRKQNTIVSIWAWAEQFIPVQWQIWKTHEMWL